MELQSVGYNSATKLTHQMLGLEKPLICDSDGPENMASLHVFPSVKK